MRAGALAVALTTSLGGTVGTAAELRPDSLNPAGVGAWQNLIGATGLIAISAILSQAPWQHRLRTRWLALGGSSAASDTFIFFEAVSRTGVTIGTLVAIGVAALGLPLFFGGWFMVGGRVRGLWGWSCCQCYVGVSCCTGCRPGRCLGGFGVW